MKVITLMQPWASLVVLGHKKIETRSFDTKFTGDILIHASLKKIKLDKDTHKLVSEMQKIPGFLENYGKLPYGAIIGKAKIVTTSILCPPYKDDVAPFGIYYNQYGAAFSEKELAFGNYDASRYGWLLAEPVEFDTPIPAKGSLSMWNFRMCRICGCHDADACFHKDLGNCSWAGQDICSHCIMAPREAVRYSKHIKQ